MDFAKLLNSVNSIEEEFPPVHLWNPELCQGVEMKIDRETVNKNALTFNKLVINPIRNGFCNKDFGSLLSEELLKIKKLRPIYSKYKPPKILMNNFASSLL